MPCLPVKCEASNNLPVTPSASMHSAHRFPIEEIPTRGEAVPVVLSLPHSGMATPSSERDVYAQNPDDVALAGDLYVDALYREAIDFGVTVVRTPFSRFLVDLNRLPDDFSPASVDGARSRGESGYHGQRGVIWAVSPDGRSLYKRPLSRSEAALRLERYYYPYQRALRTHLHELRARFGYAILIDAHSMPSQSMNQRSGPRADIVPGDLEGTSCSPELSRFVCRWWEDAGYTVHPNRPYRGGAITRQHGRPDAGIHAIQIELNRALYMDEKTLRFSAGFSQLRADCSGFLEELTTINLALRNAAE